MRLGREPGRAALHPGTSALLRCMHLMRRTLGEAGTSAASVTDVAMRYGFWQLGRFARLIPFSVHRYRSTEPRRRLHQWRLPSRMRRAEWSCGHPQTSPGVPRQTCGCLRARRLPCRVRRTERRGGRPEVVLAPSSSCASFSHAEDSGRGAGHRSSIQSLQKGRSAAAPLGRLCAAICCVRVRGGDPISGTGRGAQIAKLLKPRAPKPVLGRRMLRFPHLRPEG